MSLKQRNMRADEECRQGFGHWKSVAIMYSLFSRPLPGPSPTVPSVDPMQLFLGSVRPRASSWGTRPPFLPLPPSPRACSQATDCGQCKECFCTISANPLNNNKVELDEQHIQQMQSTGNASFWETGVPSKERPVQPSYYSWTNRITQSI